MEGLDDRREGRRSPSVANPILGVGRAPVREPARAKQRRSLVVRRVELINRNGLVRTVRIVVTRDSRFTSRANFASGTVVASPNDPPCAVFPRDSYFTLASLTSNTRRTCPISVTKHLPTATLSR